MEYPLSVHQRGKKALDSEKGLYYIRDTAEEKRIVLGHCALLMNTPGKGARFPQSIVIADKEVSSKLEMEQ